MLLLPNTFRSFDPKGQSRMDNPEKQATLDTQNTRRRKKQKQKTKTKTKKHANTNNINKT